MTPPPPRDVLPCCIHRTLALSHEPSLSPLPEPVPVTAIRNPLNSPETHLLQEYGAQPVANWQRECREDARAKQHLHGAESERELSQGLRGV